MVIQTPLQQAYIFSACGCGCLAGGKGPPGGGGSGGLPPAGMETVYAVLPQNYFPGMGNGKYIVPGVVQLDGAILSYEPGIVVDGGIGVPITGTPPPAASEVPIQFYLSKKVVTSSTGFFGNASQIVKQSYGPPAYELVNGVVTPAPLVVNKTTGGPLPDVGEIHTTQYWTVQVGNYTLTFHYDEFIFRADNSSIVWTDNEMTQIYNYAELASIHIDTYFTTPDGASHHVVWDVPNQGPYAGKAYQTVTTVTTLYDTFDFDSLGQAILDQFDLYDFNLYFTTYDNPSVLCQWSPVSNSSHAYGTTPYYVYRSTDGVNYGRVFSSDVSNGFTTSFTDTHLTAGQDYYYYVTAIVGGIETGPSNKNVVTIPLPPVNPFSYVANAFPPPPPSALGSGVPAYFTAYAFNPQMRVIYGDIRGIHYCRAFLAYPIVGGRIIIGNPGEPYSPGFDGHYGDTDPYNVFLAAKRLTGNPHGFANFPSSGIIYAKSVGFFTITIDDHNKYPNGRNFYFEHSSLDGQDSPVTVTSQFWPPSRPLLVFAYKEFGLLMASPTQLAYNPSDCIGFGDLYYAP